MTSDPPSGASSTKRPKWAHLVPLSVVVPVAVAGLAAIAIATALAWQTSDKWLDDLLSEVAKAGVQVVAVGVLGGLLAAAWKDRELDRAAHERELDAGTARREKELEADRAVREKALEADRAVREKALEADRAAREKELEADRAAREKALEADRAAREKVRDELMVIVGLYNRVKLVRRTLRSEGLDLKARGRPDSPVDADLALSASQVEAFQRQMRSLTMVQLELESKVRQFGQTNLLGEDTELVVKRLDEIESYLNRILKDAWEQRGWTIEVGSKMTAVSEPLQSLFRQAEFRPQMSEPLREITNRMNKYAFGEATRETSEALQTILQRQDAEDDLPTE